MADLTVAGSDSECGYCERPIRKGEDIVLVDGWWCHADCAEAGAAAYPDDDETGEDRYGF